MTISRLCPVCGGYALAFEAAATVKDRDIIAVIGRCQHCKYKFSFKFGFDEMHTENVVESGPEHDPRFHLPDVAEPGVVGKTEGAEQQHRRWLGQDRQTPGAPYDPGRVSTPDHEGPPDE